MPSKARVIAHSAPLSREQAHLARPPSCKQEGEQVTQQPSYSLQHIRGLCQTHPTYLGGLQVCFSSARRWINEDREGQIDTETVLKRSPPVHNLGFKDHSDSRNYAIRVTVQEHARKGSVKGPKPQRLIELSFDVIHSSCDARMGNPQSDESPAGR